jgi:hypothetical protein
VEDRDCNVGCGGCGIVDVKDVREGLGFQFEENVLY